jgi:hypothetical protein
MMPQYREGMRVRASVEYKMTFPTARKNRDYGTIQRPGLSPNCWRVKWDELPASESLHEDFFEPLEIAAAPSE